MKYLNCTSCGTIREYSSIHSYYNSRKKLLETGVLRCYQCAAIEDSLLRNKKRSVSKRDSKKEIKPIEYKIYKITNPANEIYIGCTKDSLSYRLRGHVATLNGNIHRGKKLAPIQQSIQKWGVYNHTIEQVEFLGIISKQEALLIEDSYIKSFQTKHTLLNKCKISR